MPWTDEGVYNPPGANLLGHAGGGAGSIAFLAMDVANRHGVIVLTNQSKVRPNPVGWTLVQRLAFTKNNTTHAVREFVGIGVVLQKPTTADDLRIIQVFPESSAGKAGVAANTVITEIGGTSVEGKKLEECYGLLSGKANTSVRLRLRNSEGAYREVELRRRRFLTTS